MKTLTTALIIIICAIVSSCSSFESSVYQDVNSSVSNWWSREGDVNYIEGNNLSLDDIIFADKVSEQVYTDIPYDHDKANLHYYQTSEETLTLSKGVCVDHSILIYDTLREQGYPDKYIGCQVYIRDGISIYHVVPVIFPEGDKSDYILLGPIYEDHRLIMGFSLFEIWTYDL